VIRFGPAVPAGVVDEQQVDIRAVVQLVAAELAEGEDGETAVARPPVPHPEIFRDAAIGHIQDGVGQAGDFLGSRGQRAAAQNVAQNDAEDLAAPESGQGER